MLHDAQQSPVATSYHCPTGQPTVTVAQCACIQSTSLSTVCRYHRPMNIYKLRSVQSHQFLKCADNAMLWTVCELHTVKSLPLSTACLAPIVRRRLWMDVSRQLILTRTNTRQAIPANPQFRKKRPKLKIYYFLRCSVYGCLQSGLEMSLMLLNSTVCDGWCVLEDTQLVKVYSS